MTETSIHVAERFVLPTLQGHRFDSCWRQEFFEFFQTVPVHCPDMTEILLKRL